MGAVKGRKQEATLTTQALGLSLVIDINFVALIHHVSEMFYHLDDANWYHFPPCFTFHDKGDNMHPEHTLTLSAWLTEAQEQEIMALMATGTDGGKGWSDPSSQ